MKNQDKYKIVSTKRGFTSRGASYYDIEAIRVEDGEVVRCVYFGNTKPRRLLDIIMRETENSTYYIGVIQPHTSRDKKTGRFTSYQRVGAHI